MGVAGFSFWKLMSEEKTEPAAASDSRMRAYYELMKPGIAGYVMITAGAAAFVGSRGTIDLLFAVHTMLGTGIATAGALTLNQYVERDVDAIMHRTRQRPLPSGRLRPSEALAFGLVLLVGGLAYLGALVGLVPAALAALSAAVYHLVYTPLKSRSYVATLAGSFPGALPMLIGWTAGTGDFNAAGGWLFAIGYLWQLPHVLGLAWMLQKDYARVGFKLIPEGGAKVIGRHMVVATGLLIPVSLAPTILGYTGLIYAAGAVVLGTAFVVRAVGAAKDLTETTARRVFFGSLLYHPLLLVLMLFDTIPM
jgi:heme o synthase